jgi:hypothetical protein
MKSPRSTRLPEPGPKAAARGTAIATAVRQEKATRWAADLAPILAEIRASGATSLGQIAGALNARGIPAAKGGSWSKTQVMRVLGRLGSKAPAR